MSIFKKLWENHPTITNNNHPCKTGSTSNFENQCAIRLGVSFQKSGINLNNIPGLRYCWQHEKKEGHILSAQEFANGLARTRIPGIGLLEKVPANDRESFQIFLKKAQGIIFFQRFNGFDHIDLWNGNRMTDLRTWWLSTSLFSGANFLSHRKSQEIWFWRVL